MATKRWLALDEATEARAAFASTLREVTEGLPTRLVWQLEKELDQLCSAEYEAGYEAGRAQKP